MTSFFQPGDEAVIILEKSTDYLPPVPQRIDYIKSSPMAASLSTSFHALVTIARRKISEEKARIEDEAAAALDVSKVYDIHTLLPRRDICLDQKRRVKARDCFTMRFYHSSDENIERTIELILRDPSPRSKYSEGEILFVEVDESSSKWLLFPPVPLSAISARTGDAAGEIVVMVRGLDQEAQEWREVMALASSTAAGFEWVQMLGLIPIPPEGPFSKEPIQPAILETVIEESIAPSRHYSPVKPRRRRSRHAPKLNVFDFLEPETKEGSENIPTEESEIDPHPTSISAETAAEEDLEDLEEPKPDPQFTLPPGWLPPDFSAALVNPLVKCDFIGGEFEVANITFKYEKPATRDSSGLRSPSLHTLTDAGRSGSPTPSNKSASNIQRSRRASRPHSRNKSLSGQSVSSVTEDTQESEHLLSRTRSVHLDDEERANPSRDEPPTPKRSTVSPMDNIPSLLPIGPSKGEREPDGDSPPPVPPHRTPTIAKHGNSRPEPISTAPPAPAFGGRRRTSSPLKHEYDPSSPSNSDSEHAEEDQRLEHDHDDSSSSSSSSEDEESDDAVSLCSEEEDGDYPPPLLSIPRRISRQASSIVSSPRQRSSSAAIEDADVDNASELTPLARTPITPPQPQQPPPPVPQIGAKFRAFIFTWSTNQWEKVSPGECKVIITPGHIEVFPLTTSVPTSPGSPAVANDKMVTSLGSYDSLRSQGESIFSFDLTASLPVRRGTAVDISIRTPPSSKMAGASIMLRSRSPNECEMLYNTLNGSRNYPQHQLPPTTTISSQSLPSEMSNNDSSGGSIKRGFGAWARSKTYRAGASISTPSLVSSPSEASVNSISSAFSRFRAGKIFKNSPLGSAASSSSSMAGSSRGGSPIGLPNVAGIENSIVQMSPMKIRLYRRENASKWRDLGNARLNVLKPLEGQRGRSMNDDDKRIVIVNKKGTTVLLDVVLGESAFERVARTGIAVSILVGEGEEDGTGKPGDVGGIGAKSTVYMMQVCCP
jgi:hypothetical protein